MRLPGRGTHIVPYQFHARVLFRIRTYLTSLSYDLLLLQSSFFLALSILNSLSSCLQNSPTTEAQNDCRPRQQVISKRREKYIHDRVTPLLRYYRARPLRPQGPSFRSVSPLSHVSSGSIFVRDARD